MTGSLNSICSSGPCVRAGGATDGLNMAVEQMDSYCMMEGDGVVAKHFKYHLGAQSDTALYNQPEVPNGQLYTLS